MSKRSPSKMDITSLLNPVGEFGETRSQRSGSSSRADAYTPSPTDNELLRIEPKNPLTVLERGAEITNGEKWAFEQTKDGARFEEDSPAGKALSRFEDKTSKKKSKTQSNAQRLGSIRRN